MKKNPAQGGKPQKGKKGHRVLIDDLSLLPVLISPARDSRPKEKKTPSARCPFCPGGEELTPPTLVAFPDEDGWQIRVFKNLFPLLATDQKSETYGVHEVIVETPKHDAIFHKLPLRQISLALQAIRDRMRHHSSNPRLRSLMAFRNQGVRGGASLVHPHTQFVGLSWVPPRIANESEGFVRLAEQGRCPLCLGARDPLIIVEQDSFRAFSPHAPRFPRETWIAPVHHEPAFTTLKDSHLDDLASLLKKIMTSIGKLTSRAKRPFDYNLVFHTEPLDDDSGTFHAHIEILPRPESLAGFEIGSGLFVNPIPPEQSVSELREVLFS